MSLKNVCEVCKRYDNVVVRTPRATYVHSHCLVRDLRERISQTAISFSSEQVQLIQERVTFIATWGLSREDCVADVRNVFTQTFEKISQNFFKQGQESFCVERAFICAVAHRNRLVSGLVLDYLSNKEESELCEPFWIKALEVAYQCSPLFAREIAQMIVQKLSFQLIHRVFFVMFRTLMTSQIRAVIEEALGVVPKKRRCTELGGEVDARAPSALDAPTHSYVITRIRDRYGINGLQWIAAILLATHERVSLYHLCGSRCKTIWDSTAWHGLLVQHCVPISRLDEESNAIPLNIIPETVGRVLTTCVFSLGMDIPTACQRFAKKWFQEHFQARAEKMGWSLPWSVDSSQVIVIHVRLDDVAPPFDNPYTTCCCKLGGVMNADNACQEERLTEGFIGESQLIEVIQRLRNRFSKHQIFLITAPNKNDLILCERIIQKLPSRMVEKVIDTADRDAALWTMMCSDILVQSRSGFSLVAGLLHQGSHCFLVEHFNICQRIGGENSTRWSWF